MDFHFSCVTGGPVLLQDSINQKAITRVLVIARIVNQNEPLFGEVGCLTHFVSHIKLIHIDLCLYVLNVSCLSLIKAPLTGFRSYSKPRTISFQDPLCL